MTVSAVRAVLEECVSKSTGMQPPIPRYIVRRHRPFLKCGRKKAKEFVKKIKQYIGECECCGLKVNDEQYVFDFDHLEPSTKLGNVSDMTTSGNIFKLADEIEKTRLLCSNCHRRRTFRPGRFYALS